MAGTKGIRWDELEAPVQAAADREGISFSAWVKRAVRNELSRSIGLYRTKPDITIAALPVRDLLTTPREDLPEWVTDGIRRNLIRVNGEQVTVMTLEGDRSAHADGWVLKGTEDELYPIRDSIFRNKYEPVIP
jgi:hypothetical protein